MGCPERKNSAEYHAFGMYWMTDTVNDDRLQSKLRQDAPKHCTMPIYWRVEIQGDVSSTLTVYGGQ
jgi:hypothetical protein